MRCVNIDVNNCKRFYAFITFDAIKTQVVYCCKLAITQKFDKVTDCLYPNVNRLTVDIFNGYWGDILSIFDNPMWNKIYPELSGSYPESANSKSKNPESAEKWQSVGP